MSPLGRFADFSYLIHLKIWHETTSLGDAALANNHPLGAELLALRLFDHAL
jgi:hypothetical protein